LYRIDPSSPANEKPPKRLIAARKRKLVGRIVIAAHEKKRQIQDRPDEVEIADPHIATAYQQLDILIRPAQEVGAQHLGSLDITDC
jgi:hypothetical protein